MESNVIDLCKKELKAISSPLLIPEEIENLIREKPNNIIYCNEITEELATAILEKDRDKLDVMRYFCGLVNPVVFNFLKNNVKNEDIILIHHYWKKNYYTSVVKIMYLYDGMIIYEKPKWYIKLCQKIGGIEYNNIIALAKIPTEKKIAKRCVIDNDQSVFVDIGKRIFKLTKH